MTLSPEILDRLPPQDLAAEKGVLGSIILKPDVLDELAILEANDFYNQGYAAFFTQLRVMHSERIPIDTVSVVARLKQSAAFEQIDGMAGLADVVQSVPYASNAVYYAELVVKASRKRAMITAATNLLRDSYDDTQEPADILNQAEAALSAINSGGGRGEPVSAKDLAIEVMDRIDFIQERGSATGIMTGLHVFDQAIGGLFPEELIILAARPGVGKSALAMQIACHNASKGRTVLFVSLEMSRVELTMRSICAASGVNNKEVRSARLTDTHITALSGAVRDFSGVSLHVQDHAQSSVYDIRRDARKLKRTGLELVVVDYLQLLKPENTRDQRHLQIGAMTRALKALSRELKIPVMCLCQLNRQAATGDYPKLSHLRESGDIEQDADVVLMLHNPTVGIEEPDPNAKPPALLVHKNRNGITGKFDLEWIAHKTQYQCSTPKGDPCFAEYANENRTGDF